MDRGNETVTTAIKLLSGETISLSKKDTISVQRWIETLHHIEKNITSLALPEDAAVVLDCFNEQVLHNEVRLHELSIEYQKTVQQNQYAFLETHSKTVARLMVIDAGFPSVTSSLYSIYRHNNEHLPSLSEVHSDPIITSLLQVCNAVVRIADEFGDWEADAGYHPEWGIFSINPFNQYHPILIEELCSLATITDRHLIKELHEAFSMFHAVPDERNQRGQFIVDSFFEQARTYINSLPTASQKRHGRYITLCKRVLEIGSVNILGDIALADIEQEE